MADILARIRATVDSRLPLETPRRKVAEITAVILLAEGLSVLLLFSYASLLIGLLSIAIGSLLLLILRGRRALSRQKKGTYGVRLVDYLVNLVGGEYVVALLGILMVCSVIVYNNYASERPEIGDIDTLTILFGVVIATYPWIRRQFPVEGAFTVVFLGGVVLLLAAPQVVMALTAQGEGDSSIGNWYVHYMLAAPFSGMLDLIGIHSESYGNVVTIVFEDGSMHSLSISAYCAGLYSFSIFVSAFAAFVLVFEEMPRKMMAMVLSLGLIAAYFGNLLRMVIIGLVGYYEGIDALRWAHENVGWIIFLAWSSLFWYIVINYAGRSKTGQRPLQSEGEG